MKYSLLDGINSPSDLKKLNKSDIPTLSSEIRDFLIENAKEHGGHLASNLGVVELTLAIHTVFDSPKDHIVFDVGHQSYVHKLLTGRREAFDTLRIPGGLSGFTSMKESEHDAFGSGHSSNSISAALGIARSDNLSGNACHTVCVTGDGAFTGGMAHEALNNCPKKLPLVIILNENGMSISSTKGAFASYVSHVRVSLGYAKFKTNTKNFLDKLPLIGKPIRFLLRCIKRAIKKLVYKPNYFEELGLYYIGPIDGHDYNAVCKALTLAKQSGKTCVVHVKTVKGKGYEPAESSPDGYHSFNSASPEGGFGKSFADELIAMAEKNDKIVGITAAMGIGTGLDRFGKVYPDRYFDVGIAEAHALTFAAGLARGGHIPFVALYSTFLQRGYDSLLHDVALQNLPVKIMIDRAGLALGDGATHHGIFDVSFISHIPNMTLLAPASFASLREMMHFAEGHDGPVAIRYPNAKEPICLNRFRSISDSPTCKICVDYDTQNTPEHLFITYGSLVDRVKSATDILKKQGIAVGIILIESLKPYGPVAEELIKLISPAKRVVFAEEGIKSGGAAELCREELMLRGLDILRTEYRIAAIEDNFASPSEMCDLYDYVGLSAEKLAKKMKD